jgi:hypothetical protein
MCGSLAAGGLLLDIGLGPDLGVLLGVCFVALLILQLSPLNRLVLELLGGVLTVQDYHHKVSVDLSCLTGLSIESDPSPLGLNGWTKLLVVLRSGSEQATFRFNARAERRMRAIIEVVDQRRLDAGREV